jgi:hypothetical protein
LKEALTAGAARRDLVVGSRAAFDYWFATKGKLVLLVYVLMASIVPSPVVRAAHGWQRLREILID